MSVYQIREMRQVMVPSALASSADNSRSRKVTIYVGAGAPPVPANVTLMAEDGSLPPANGGPPRPRWMPAGRTYVARHDGGEPGSYVIEGGGGEMMAGLSVEIIGHR